jgi:extradiol dioxygenase family protein
MKKNIDHIALQVNNIKESVDWYVENYGCSIIYSDDSWAMLQFGNIKLALVVEDEHPYHIAFEIDGIQGNGSSWLYHRDDTISRYIDDPSGNKVELIWYPKWDKTVRDIHGNEYDPKKALNNGQHDFAEDN